jgi:hypothetical protein
MNNTNTPNKIIISTLLTVACIFFSNSELKAQACGQGIFTIEFFTLNGEKEYEINYEIFLINRDSLEAIFSDDIYLDQIMYNSYHGHIIQAKHAARIIDSTESGQNKLENLFKLAMFKDDKRIGKVKNSRVKFTTYELYFNLLLIKFKSNDKEIYVIGNLFGDCDRTSVLLWNERPQIVGKL